jgi:hypothetical protein
METTATDDLASLAASFPLLVYDHGEQPDNYHTMLSVANESSRTCRVPELRNNRCLETPCGLVLVADSISSQCSLWNPQTGEKIALPALDRAMSQFCPCLLSDAVSSPDCLVLINVRQLELLFCHDQGRRGERVGHPALRHWLLHGAGEPLRPHLGDLQHGRRAREVLLLRGGQWMRSGFSASLKIRSRAWR